MERAVAAAEAPWGKPEEVGGAGPWEAGTAILNQTTLQGYIYSKEVEEIFFKKNAVAELFN